MQQIKDQREYGRENNIYMAAIFDLHHSWSDRRHQEDRKTRGDK